MSSAESKTVPGAHPLGARKTRPARSSGPLELSEAAIARTCSDILILDGWRMLITDPVSDKARGKGFGELGMADRLYIRYFFADEVSNPHRLPASRKTQRDCATTQVLWIEWKRTLRGKPTKPTPQQIAWHAAERARGALTLIAGVDFPATIEGFRAWYAQSGLARTGTSR